MSNLRPFQIATLAVFAVLAVVSVFLLSNFSPSGSEDVSMYGERVLIWGTLDQDSISSVIEDLENANKGLEVVEYEQIDSQAFDQTFLKAIAEGYPPDLILLPSSVLISQRGRLVAIPYDYVSKRTIQDTYVEGVDVFARPDGLYAMPVLLDPMVLYWNRELLSAVGIATPPQTWEQIVATYVPKLTRKDNSRTIFQSALAFGESRNILNVKNILLTLLLQSGSLMVREENAQYVVELNKTAANEVDSQPFTTVLQFYTNFSNPNSSVYSWNRAQPLDRSAFIAGDLALYFGLGSEHSTIEGLNPNLNFDMAPVPQGAGARILRTYAEFYGFAIPKTAQNQQGAYLVARDLSTPEVATRLAQAVDMVPVHRSLIAAGSADPVEQTRYSTALIARAWLDPNPSVTSSLLQNAIDDILAGRKSINNSVGDTEQQIRYAF